MISMIVTRLYAEAFALTVLALAGAASADARLSAGGDASEERVLGACIENVAAGRPWLARTLWGLRDQERGWIGAAVPNTNGSHDLGPMQVNSWWVPRLAAALGRRPAEIRRWLQFDACFNVDAARWIFVSGLNRTKNYWRAVGVYHSPTPGRQRRYAANVGRHLRRRYGAGVFASPERDAAQGTRIGGAQ